MEDPGQENSIARLYMDGELEAELGGLQFGTDKGWAIRGLNADDYWGGNIEDHQNPGPQQCYYSNYRIYAP